MINKNIYKGLGGLDPELIEKAAPTEKLRKKKNNAWIKWVSLVACICLIISSIIIVPMLQENTPPDFVLNGTDFSSDLIDDEEENNLPDVPKWDNAKYSAAKIASLFGRQNQNIESVATNAYTKIYTPSSEYLHIDDMINDEYVNIYRYEDANNELNKEEFNSFIGDILPRVSKSLGFSTPQYSIKERNYVEGNEIIYTDINKGFYFISFSQSDARNRFSLSKREDRKIIIDGETIQIDQRLTDEKILESIRSIKNKLFEICGVSFSDAKILRTFDSNSEYGAEFITIYFYDESAHYLNSLRGTPISDYISISFDNFKNYSDDIVSDSILMVANIEYNNSRFDVNEVYELVGMAKKISVSEAEALLYKGYVFGGHACKLCMEAQDKVSFDRYDFVDVEYKFGYDSPTEGIPFYAFYKNIGQSENGNTIYAKTYVPAVQVSGYAEYFESQVDEHEANRHFVVEIEST